MDKDKIKILDNVLFNQFIDTLEQEATHDNTVRRLFSPEGISNFYMYGKEHGAQHFVFRGNGGVEEVKVLDITKIDTASEFINFINKKRSERIERMKNGGKKRNIKTRKGKSKKSKKTKKSKKSTRRKR